MGSLRPTGGPESHSSVYRFAPFSPRTACGHSVMLSGKEAAGTGQESQGTAPSSMLLPPPPLSALWPAGSYLLRISQSCSQLSLTWGQAAFHPAPSSAHFLGHRQPQTTLTAATTLSRPKSLAEGLHFCLALPETRHLAAGPQKSTNLG